MIDTVRIRSMPASRVSHRQSFELSLSPLTPAAVPSRAFAQAASLGIEAVLDSKTFGSARSPAYLNNAFLKSQAPSCPQV